MPRTAKQPNTNGGNRDEQIAYMRENCPEESVLYLIFRGNAQTISVFRLYLDGMGFPKIECLDHAVSLIMGYKLRDEAKLEGLQITASQDQDMTAEMLVMALSRYVHGSYGKFSHKWL
jgi:hypothetical protein